MFSFSSLLKHIFCCLDHIAHAFLSFITPKNKGSPLISPHKWMLFYVYRVILHLSSDKIITFQLISKRSDKETEVR